MIKIYRGNDIPLELELDTLREARFNNMSFHRCLLNGLDFSFSHFTEVDFRSAEMKNCIFCDSVFEDAKLIMVEALNSNFDKCIFLRALFLHSDFSNASFNKADLSNSIVRDSIFANCDFRGANISCEGLDTCVLENAIYNHETIWNEKFNPSEFGAVLVQ